MNTKSLLLVGLLSFAPAVVVACECGCDKAVEEVKTVVVAEDAAKKAVVTTEVTTEVTVQDAAVEAAPVK